MALEVGNIYQKTYDVWQVSRTKLCSEEFEIEELVYVFFENYTTFRILLQPSRI